jgi:hypothetical protein
VADRMSAAEAEPAGADQPPPPSPWAALETRECSVCAAAMPFEVAPCADGHEEDCPDRVCLGCGAVVVVGPAPLARGA